MSNQEFENYLKLIGKLLQLSRSQQKQIAGELQDHLQSRVADLVADGVDHEIAVGLALEEFGDAAVMAKNFQAVMKLKRRRWMMRFATVSMASAFFLAVFSMAMWPTTARFGAPELARGQDQTSEAKAKQDSTMEPSSRTQRDLVAEAILRKPVTLEYLEVPFGEVIAELEDQVGLNFHLDQSAQDDSLTMDEPITFRIHDVPLEKALSIMLKEKNATFFINEGVVVFISRDEQDNPDYMRVRMYNCKSLIEKLASSSGDRPPIPVVGMEGGGMEGSGGMGGGGMGMGGGGTGMGGGGMGTGSRPVVDSKQDVLLDLVYRMVEPDGWDYTGRGIASAKIINGVLIVKHRQSAFGQIESLLRDLAYQIESKGGIENAAMLVPQVRRTKESPLESDSLIGGGDPFGGSVGQNPFTAGAGTGKKEDPVSGDNENPFGG